MVTLFHFLPRGSQVDWGFCGERWAASTSYITHVTCMKCRKKIVLAAKLGCLPGYREVKPYRMEV